MATRSDDLTMPEKMKMVKVVNYFDSRQDNMSSAFERVPAEIWTKIFEEFGNLYEKPYERDRKLSSLRVVSDKWASIIDNHINFTMTFTDDLLSTPLEEVAHVRLKTLHVSIDAALIHPRKLLFFLVPNLWVSYQRMNQDKPPNFLKLVEGIPGLSKCLKMKEIGIHDWDSMFVAITPQHPISVNQFWKGITRLCLDIPFLDIQLSGGWDVINFKLILKIVHFPNLKEFNMRTIWITMIDKLLLFFIARHQSTLRNIHLDLFFQGDEIESLQEYQQQPSKSALKFLRDVKKIQLESVSFEGETICQVGRDTWISLLKLQRNLSRLTIMDPYHTNPFSFSDLAILIKQNYLTLTSLQVMIHFGGEVNLKAFQNMKRLKSLTLRKNSNENFAKLVNANCLPATLEKLVITELSLDCPTLIQIARSPQLTNLKHLELSGVSTCIPIEVVYQFIEKESLEVLDLCPVQRGVMPNNEENGGQPFSFDRLQFQRCEQCKKLRQII